jgi:glutamate synthase (ferredoxin)
MMRVCHLDTCPEGVATQNPELRKNFKGDPQHVINFMHFIAQDMRELMARLGVRTVQELVGRSDYLRPRKNIDHWKARNLDFTEILHRLDDESENGVFCTVKQDHGLEFTLDHQVLLDLCKPAIENGESVEATLPIHNINRVTGTSVGSEVTRKHGANGLPEDTIRLHFQGSAGQSFGAFIPKGMTMILEGDSNDYIGKGLSGGKIIVYPPQESTFAAEENIIIGNVAFYGATSGEAYVRGVAGERFCVRNSGMDAVVEGVGDHGCEYMTGGRVVVLGSYGRNFAAGMSGGVAYVLDEKGSFPLYCNQEMVTIQKVEDPQEADEVRKMIQRHADNTNSALAQRILANWETFLPKFARVMPQDYERALETLREVQASGLIGDDAVMAAFERNKNDLARVTGN